MHLDLVPAADAAAGPPPPLLDPLPANSQPSAAQSDAISASGKATAADRPPFILDASADATSDLDTAVELMSRFTDRSLGNGDLSSGVPLIPLPTTDLLRPSPR